MSIGLLFFLPFNARTVSCLLNVTLSWVMLARVATVNVIGSNGQHC